MKLKLKREFFGDNATIGRLYLDDQFVGYTLEDKYREVEGQPTSMWKVMSKTAIPKGTYNVSVTLSQRFKTYLPLLSDVPGFSGVRIHTGNSSADTEGCILVGSTWDGKSEWIGASKIAFIPLLKRLEETKEPITISIS